MDNEKYLEELKLMNEVLKNIEDKITTFHGKGEYNRIKHTLETLIELNSKEDENAGGWVSI